MALLQAINGENAGQRYLIAGDNAVIGRDPDCDVVLHVTAVSRRHARVFVDSGTFFIEDLHSRNGTFVNGQPVVAPQRLAENDRVAVCEAMFSFHQQSSPTLLVDEDGDTVGAGVRATVQLKAPRASLHAAMVSAEAKLNAILEVSQSIGSALAEDEVLNKILDSLFKIFLQAERGFVVLCEGADDALVIMAEKHRHPDDDVSAWLSRTLVSRAMASREAILSSDAANDPRFRQGDLRMSSALLRIRSVVCAPLVDSQGKALGVLQLDTLDQRTPFDQPDLELLATVARLAAIAIENARLHETAMKKRAMDHDLSIARDVQHRFLPKKAPELAGYEFFHFYEAAEQLGGDYFDYIWLPGDRLAVVLADVSGKGIPAALLMARLAAETRYLLVGQPDPAVAFDRLCAGWDDGFVTMTVAILDGANHEVQFVNAGNLPPMLRHAEGRVEQLGEEHTCLPLGVSPDFKYESFKVSLAPGESIVMLTDGISEAMNDDNELYGIGRLQDQLFRGAAGVAELGSQLLADVKEFVGERSQADDMCLVCFGRV
ncbi:MAG TPA: SpoIIE family protein phosphatase [Pirellulales bacterium]|jgi:serine phosphatase RsbU (regulator of sigma subunit)|nr:SpoIIE family protein phosphatase [Pirellulales bacterium]